MRFFPEATRIEVLDRSGPRADLRLERRVVRLRHPRLHRRRVRPAVCGTSTPRSQKTTSWGAFLPSVSVQFLALDEILAIQTGVIEAFDGGDVVRDLGLLESAPYRPQPGCYEDLVSMAAALFDSLVMNHPFVDGNQRVAFFATDVFLRLNGRRLDVDADDANSLLIELLEMGRCDFEHLSSWIRDSATPR